MPLSREAVEKLTPEQAADELRSLAEAVPSMLAFAGAPEDVPPPIEDGELKEALALAVEVADVQARRISELEAALTYEHRHRLLPAAREASW
jgi:hypothetical protein